jgi:hypothetical protein
LADKKITATIAWNDPAGIVPEISLDPTTPIIVNDLDIKLKDEDGNVTALPWILDVANPSVAAARGDNIRDNVEKIEFDNPENKSYVLEISHKGSLAGNQRFSLIITHESETITGKTFYWIGGSGNWTDTAHWSLTTGGIKAEALPSSNDVVIVDDNSFGGIEEDTLRLDTTAVCKTMIWMANKPGALSMNRDTLSVVKGLTIASEYFRTLNGGFFEFKGGGVLNYQSGNMTKDTLAFDGGDWIVNGKLDVQKIIVTTDDLDLSNQDLIIRELEVNTSASLDLTGSTVDSLRQSVIQDATLETNRTHINIAFPSVLSWDGISFQGILNIKPEGVLTLEGNNTLDSLVVWGGIFINGTNTIKYFEADTGAVVLLKPAATQTVTSLVFAGNETDDTEIKSATLENAFILLQDHEKICFDYLSVSDVDIVGEAVVTAGEHSVVTDSDGWLTVACDEVLFPDFVAYFTCKHGLTLFADRSTGPITNWEWNFGDPASQNNSFVGSNARHQFSDIGIYNVALTVSNGTLEQTYIVPIEIQPSIMQANTILFVSGTLTSTAVAEYYQWYFNGEPIMDAINPDLEPEDVGTYQVVTTIGDCNYISEPYLLVGTEPQVAVYTLYPNPASRELRINFNDNKRHEIRFYNAMGQQMFETTIVENEAVLNVEKLKEGLYILNADGYNAKIMIKR